MRESSRGGDNRRRANCPQRKETPVPSRRIVAAAVSTWMSLGGVALAATPAEVPEKLRVAPDQVLAFDFRGEGVQIYVCTASKDDATKFEWMLKAPEAQLFDAAGRQVGKHYAGPTWEGNDGSKVVGELKARDDGPDPNAIPWLLLSAKASSGSGMFGNTTSVQRLRTVGGKAPAEGCGKAADTGSEVRVPYQARYAFYKRKQ
jgi:Protein of unknown function (DUF3455)